MFNINTLEELAVGDSVLHRLNPLCKLMVTLTYIVLTVSFPRGDIAGISVFLLYPAILVPLSGTPWGVLFKRAAFALPFALFTGIGSVWVVYAVILLKTILCVFAALLLMSVTTMAELCACLTKIRVPRIFCLQLSQSYRYISLLVGEARTMYTSYKLRSTNKKGIKIRDMGFFLGQLLIRSVAKADRVYLAMKTRGFSGEYAVAARKFTPRDFASLTVCLALMFLARFADIASLIGGIFA